MNKQIKISIILPVFNSGKYLKICVDTILKQDFEEFELLLIDDGSTDGSSNVCDQIADKDERVKVFHMKNGGICAARNFGLENANGEYIAFSDHDDKVLPGFLKENYDFAKLHNADIIKFGRESLIISDEVLLKKSIRKFQREIVCANGIKENFLKYRFLGAMTCIWDGFFRAEFLKKNKLYFNTSFKKGGEDIAFCSNCFLKADKIVFSDKVFYIHYIRMGYSTSTIFDEQHINKLHMVQDNLDSCAKYLNIEWNSNEYFLLNVVKELIYPSMIYYKRIHFSNRDMKKHMKNEQYKYSEIKPTFKSLIAADNKWGLFAILFKLGWFRLMYLALVFKK